MISRILPKRKSLSIKQLKAFSFIELLVVMALISFISLMVLPGSLNQLKSSTVSSRASELSSQIYLYQQNAFTGLGNKNFGIKFNTNSYIVFVGNSFATAESQQTTALDAGVTIKNLTLANGGSELIFSTGTLKPNTNGTINIGDALGNNYQVKINQEGFVEYYTI